MRHQGSLTSKRVSTAEEDNNREAFNSTYRLYDILLRRAISNPWYLSRNLRRDYPRPSATHRFPLVKYVSDEPGVTWYKEVPHLRCLWCKGTIPRFWNSTELLHHLRSCHGALAYSLHVASKRDSPVVISIRLLRGEEGALAAKIDRFHTYDLEEIYVNTKKYPTYLRGSKSLRLENTNGPIEPDPRVQTTSPRPKRLSEAKTKRTATKKKRKPMGKPCFKSVQQATENGRLFHSMLQVPLSFENYEEGADSDEDDTQENLWRLQLVDTEIEEFIDTIPVEKLFMILWNQFVRMEYLVRADRHVAPACMCFVKKYRRTLIRLSLENTFLRHMTELGRRGLVDADGIYDALKVLEDRDLSLGADEEEPRFLFAERFEKQEAKRTLLERKKEQAQLAGTQAVDTEMKDVL